jgi:hypothetical protein
MMTPAAARAGISAPIKAEQTTRIPVFMMNLVQPSDVSKTS